MAEEKKTSLEVTPEPMDALVHSTVITTNELAKKINGIFAPHFYDFSGCSVVRLTNPNGYSGFIVNLYFKNKGKVPDNLKNRMINNLIVNTFENTKSTDITKRVMNFTERNKFNGADIKLNEPTKEVLAEFMPMDRNGKPDWKNNCIPMPNNPASPMSDVFIVSNLRLDTFLRKIFGYRNEEGHDVEYQVEYARPMAPTMPMGMQGQAPENSMLLISQLDKDILDEKYREYNLLNPGNYQYIPV